jgi:hypothetical protein
VKRVGGFAAITMLTVLTALTTASVAQSIPFIVDIDITNYDSYVIQQPGTTATYWVEVENTGMLELDPIYVSVSKIPDDWFETQESISLEFGHTDRLYYDIAIPESQTGYVVYSLNVYGEHGQLTASDSKPVMINITSEVTTTTSTTTVPTTTTTLQTTTTQETTTTIPTSNLTLPEIPVGAYVNATASYLVEIWEMHTVEVIIAGLCIIVAVLVIVKVWLVRRR